jgi:hypothetical protein
LLLPNVIINIGFASFLHEWKAEIRPKKGNYEIAGTFKKKATL